MSKLLDDLKKTIDSTIPDKEELTHGLHPKIEYILLVFRNLFVLFAVLSFVGSLAFHNAYITLRAIGYFCGAAAYIFECLAVTDCFKSKVPHTEMFMVYCFGPLYIIMGLEYIFLH